MSSFEQRLMRITTLTLLIIAARASSNYASHQQQQQQQQQQLHLQKHYVPLVTTNQSLHVHPYWEHILREFVFKTISPPAPGNHELYKRLLEAPFYGGPFPIVPKDATTVMLSRGDVYYLPNGHWLLCQEGCVNCEVCTQYTQPTVKWVLRRVKRYSTRGSTRYDLQLTVIPQTDGSYHLKNLWPRSYIYVTSQGEQAAFWHDKLGHHGPSAYQDLEDGIPGPREKSSHFWKYVERDSLADRREIGESSVTRRPVSTTVRNDKGTTRVKLREDGTDRKNVSSKDRVKHRPRVKVPQQKVVNVSSILKENRKVESTELVPKLILGTDQLGHRHLVHVVPADGSTNGSLMNSIASNALTSTGQSKVAYQQILRKIFDSLNSNRRSIESFLEPLTKSKTKSSPNEEHRQEESRNDAARLKELARVYPVLDRTLRNDSLSEDHWPLAMNWSRQRRKSNDVAADGSHANDTGYPNGGSNNDYGTKTEPLRLVDSTNERGASKENDSAAFDHGTGNRGYYNYSGSDDSLKTGNVVQNEQEHKFAPHKFELIASTDTTTRSGEIVDLNRNDHERHDSGLMDPSAALNVSDSTPFDV